MVRAQLSGLGIVLWQASLLPRGEGWGEGSQRRARQRRRRIFTAAVSLVLCLSVTAQQAQAVPILMTTTLPKLPRVGPTASQALFEHARLLLQPLLRWFPGILPTSGGSTPAPVPPDGMPAPWQGSPDRSGPFSVCNLANGTMFSAIQLYSWPGVTFNLYHTPGLANPSSIGSSWAHSYSDLVRAFGASATYYSDDGRVITFTLTGTPGQAQNGENTMYRLKLAYDPSVSQWALTRADQSILTFNSAGVLQSVKDGSGVTTTLTHVGGLLTRVTDAAGRQLNLTYSGTQLQYVTAPSFFNIGGTTSTEVIREWKLEYNTITRVFEALRSPRTAPEDQSHYRAKFTYTGRVYLASVTDFRSDTEHAAGGFTTEYTYTDDKLTKVKHPSVYDYAPAQGSPGDYRYERNYTYTPQGGGQLTTVTDERGGLWKSAFDSGGRLTSQTDPLNRVVVSMTWNGNNQPCTIQNVFGASGTTTITYDTNGNPDTIQTPRGTINVDFSAINNLTQMVDAVGNTTRYEYTDSANPTRVTKIDGAGASDATFTWGNGSNGTPAGQIAKMVDPNFVAQTMNYDANRNIKRIRFGKSTLAESGDGMMPDTIFQNNTTGEPQGIEQATSSSDESMCGCMHQADAGGNVDGFKPGSCPPGEAQFCDQCSTAQSIAYDGNNRLVFAQYFNDPEYKLTYDARGRDIEYDVIYVFNRKRALSDSTGKMRMTARHFEGANALEAVTEMTSDAAGRLTAVKRLSGGSPGANTRDVLYTFQDSTVLPAITEDRVGVGKSDYYLDSDGAVREIAHYRYDGGASQLVTRYVYTRDANGRITQVAETHRNLSGPPDYRYATITYTYGAGRLTAADLDTNSAVALEPSKLHYSWLPAHAMAESDPNKLVKERRVADAGLVSYQKEYWYDPGGNRLAMRESVPDSQGGQTVTAITRHNYWYQVTNFADHDHRPMTPIPGTATEYAYEYGTQAEKYTTGTFYDERGQNKLISKQVLYPGDPDAADGTEFLYTITSDWSNGNGLALSNKYKYISLNMGDEQDPDWELQGQVSHTYGYNFKGQMTGANVSKSDIAGGPDLPEGTSSDTFQYDLFGRRSRKDHFPGASVVYYDYDGLSETILGERGGHTSTEPDGTPCTHLDRMQATYTYGAFGPILRTDRTDEVQYPGTPLPPGDTTDDKDAYYMADVAGNHVGLLLPPASGQTIWQPAVQLFDAFGNRVSPQPINNPQGGDYAWRGAEGSEQDRGFTGAPEDPASDFNPTSDEGTGLVYMQARYYDPEVGRFTQADRLPIASISSQGLNRYIYGNNDPVNNTDPTGRVLPFLAALGIAFLAGMLVGALLYALGVDLLGAWQSTLAGLGIAAGAVCGLTLYSMLSEPLTRVMLTMGPLIGISAFFGSLWGVLTGSTTGILASGVGIALFGGLALAAAFAAGMFLGNWLASFVDARDASSSTSEPLRFAKRGPARRETVASAC